jgi:DNA-binding NarL/FixJ family response regulator
MNILWLEDGIQSFKDFSLLLNKYNIDHRTSYIDAINALRDNNYDVYIIDCIVPSGDKHKSLADLMNCKDKYFGVEFIKAVKIKSPHSPIVVLTVVNDKDTIEAILSIDRAIYVLWKYGEDAESFAAKILSIME